MIKLLATPRSCCAAVLCALAWGCEPTIPPGRLSCNESRDCPPSWFCHPNQLCYPAPMLPEAGSAGGGGSAGAPPVTCSAPGDACQVNGDCCQTGPNLNAGARCISDDSRCHAVCNSADECVSGCCAALQGRSYGVCAKSEACATSPDCSSDDDCGSTCGGSDPYCCPACLAAAGSKHSCGYVCCDSTGFCATMFK